MCCYLIENDVIDYSETDVVKWLIITSNKINIENLCI